MRNSGSSSRLPKSQDGQVCHVRFDRMTLRSYRARAQRKGAAALVAMVQCRLRVNILLRRLDLRVVILLSRA